MELAISDFQNLSIFKWSFKNLDNVTELERFLNVARRITFYVIFLGGPLLLQLKSPILTNLKFGSNILFSSLNLYLGPLKTVWV